MLRGLYEEEAPATNILASKDIEAEDYSRGPISEYKEEMVLNSQPAHPKTKAKKNTGVPEPPPPPAPPAPPVISSKAVPPPPVPAPGENEKMLPPPVPPQTDSMVVAEEPGIPEVMPPKPLSFESFSRAPLKSKKPKGKKGSN
ncbi:MAG: hypothetical protein K0Q66_463, partial [Chitinophagaceae bacterium]|jgi:hypothetical protein|nr:hypothetical protein [Chitinophagaceae bacterium]